MEEMLDAEIDRQRARDEVCAEIRSLAFRLEIAEMKALFSAADVDTIVPSPKRARRESHIDCDRNE